MRSFLANLRQLVLPMGAQAGAPRIVLGPDIPAELVAYASFFGNITFDQVIIKYHDATTYFWDANGTFSGLPSSFRGSYDPANGVILTQRTVINGAGSVDERFGAGPNPFDITFNLIRADFQINSRSQGRGLTAWGALNSASPFVAAETTVLTLASVFFNDGRAYKIAYEADAEGSVANNSAEFKIHKGTVLGPLLRFGSSHPMAAAAGIGTTCVGSATVVNTSGTGIVTDVTLTLGSLVAGTVRIAASGDRLAFLHVYDIGAAADYPLATAL